MWLPSIYKCFNKMKHWVRKFHTISIVIYVYDEIVRRFDIGDCVFVTIETRRTYRTCWMKSLCENRIGNFNDWLQRAEQPCWICMHIHSFRSHTNSLSEIRCIGFEWNCHRLSTFWWYKRFTIALSLHFNSATKHSWCSATAHNTA